MIHRSARERLLYEAQRAGRDVTRLDGIRDHTASIVPSATGPARLVRVRDGGSEVCWIFSLETGEERPQFYPSDLPFSSALSCTVSWDDEAGLAAKWEVPSSPESFSRMKEALALLSEAKKLRVGLPDLSEIFAHDLPDTAAALMSDIVTFHEDQGWNVEAEGGKPPISIRSIWRLGARKRKLVAMSAAGVTIVELSEQVPEEEPA